ncbi:hypothetical protein ACJIZ3_014088 [Penstemon smallii]|uniref:Uncharacterized protein n=1 Tax=Penstemon smallii TaxID=265156 RepID=A0ABD3RUD8_9LAMI
MQSIGIVSKSRRAVARVIRNPSPIIFKSAQFEELATGNASELSCCSLSHRRRFHSPAFFSGVRHGNNSQLALNYQKDIVGIPMQSMVVPVRVFSSEVQVTEDDSSETAKGVYDKILNRVADLRTAPPNAWLWSLIAKCSTHEDIKLLFDILRRLRLFRLSNLRIPDGYNSALCREVTKACIRAGAIDFGKKTLWKYNLFGLTPDIASAHFLLLHAKQHNDVNLMVEVMKLVKKNELPLQPGTADILFGICCSADRWDLISKYGKRFVKSGVSLRQTSFDLWMDFAARKGDVESLWKIEKWRSEAMKKHSLLTGFSCAKGFLLDHKPESAATVIQTLKTLSDAKRPSIVVELQKLASEWPLEVIKHQKGDNKKAFAAALQNDISALIDALPSLGLQANVIVEDLSSKLEASS